MRRLLILIGVLAIAAMGLPSHADALSLAPPMFSVFATPNAIPAGNTFEVAGNCQDGDEVTIELVRQARPGRGAQVLQRRTTKVNAERRYSVTLTNNLTTNPGFPVDAQVFGRCGARTDHTPFVSTDLVYPNRNRRILTVQDAGPCGMCVAHVKGFDAFANLSTYTNGYLNLSTRSGSLTARFANDWTYALVGSGQGAPAVVATMGGGSLPIHPYGNFTGGVEVAVGSNADPWHVVTAPGPGGGPHVKMFKANNSFGYEEVGGFLAYAPSFPGGVRVAVGDVHGDDSPEIVTAAGPGGGPHVRVFSAQGVLISEFFAYSPGVTGGVSVAVGDVVAGGKKEIVTGAGPGGAPHVRTFNHAGDAISSGFYAYDQAFGHGVWVAVGNIDQQGNEEIVTGTGAGGMPHVRWFTSPDGNSTNPGFYAYEDLPTGVRVAAPHD